MWCFYTSAFILNFSVQILWKLLMGVKDKVHFVTGKEENKFQKFLLIAFSLQYVILRELREWFS